jgi:hypothetical protein
MILVDTPIIDLKSQNADKVEIFMNYMPTVMMSQIVPYLDVRFCLDRVSNKGVNSARQALYSAPSQLKFLLGSTLPDSVENDSKTKNAVDSLIFNGSIQSSSEHASLTTGMELFTMPQTLINMDYDQTTTPRYNPIINPAVPFGSILSLTINIVPSVGLMSFKTASLVLKISDRSRLNEIADFINPQLYQSTTIWLTYGWRAPQQTPGRLDDNSYHKFINDNMMKREAYGIRNSSVSIDNSGIVTVTLSLFTKAAAEMIEISPVATTAAANEAFMLIERNMKEIRNLSATLGLSGISSDSKDVRGYQLISAASQNRFPDLDNKAIASEIASIKEALKGSADSENANTLLRLLDDTFPKQDPSTPQSKPKILALAEDAAKNLAQTRFSPLTENRTDLFTISSKEKFSADTGGGRVSEVHPMTAMMQSLNNNVVGKQASKYGHFGDVSFGRLFFTYFANATKAVNRQSPIIDEYQVIFYNLNDYAGLSRCINIADFPIDMEILLDAYAKRVSQQKGENMTLFNFLEIVRDSQFANEKHKAFGFSQLYTKNKDNELELSDKSGAALNSATYKNHGAGGPFVRPVVDFYIETGYLTGGTANSDLLQSFEIASKTAANRAASDQTKIMRIHIYDKASTPNKFAEQILKDKNNFVEISSPYLNRFYKQSLQDVYAVVNNKDEKNILQKKLEVAVSAATPSKGNNDSNTGIREVSFKDANGNASFDIAKKEIARFTPTITIGSNGTTVTNVNYSTAQDALLATIMMLRNSKNDPSPSTPNGASTNDLPLRVVSGQLSLTTLGCPIVEYMQQFFVDLGTGTTIDNLYSVTGITHSIHQGKFTSELKFTFADAYGRYENPQDVASGIKNTLKKIQEAAKNRANPPKRK